MLSVNSVRHSGYLQSSEFAPGFVPSVPGFVLALGLIREVFLGAGLVEGMVGPWRVGFQEVLGCSLSREVSLASTVFFSLPSLFKFLESVFVTLEIGSSPGCKKHQNHTEYFSPA